MSRVLVVSDDGTTVVEIDTYDDGGESYTRGSCRACGADVTDRGHFEDTVQAAQIHVDYQH